MPQQSTHCVLMVSPTGFQFNEENAASNHFQHHLAAADHTVRRAAQAEFTCAARLLNHAGIKVIVHEDTSEPPKPDAVFPNNWFTTWPDGRVYVYPMAAPNRRLERSTGVIDDLRRMFDVSEVINISASEHEGGYLEATGAMVFDHPNGVVYGCVSQRCDLSLLTTHASRLGYRLVSFHAYGADGAPMYHTNVMMSIHSTTAIVCPEAIKDATERAAVLDSLAATGHDIITISFDQLSAFCGNTLELRDEANHLRLVLSQAAEAAFTPAQLTRLARDKTLLAIPVPTIEQVGGGGIRCMLAEIFLPPKTSGNDVFRPSN